MNALHFHDAGGDDDDFDDDDNAIFFLDGLKSPTRERHGILSFRTSFDAPRSKNSSLPRGLDCFLAM